MMDLHDILVGKWHFGRNASTSERFEGVARFTPRDDGALDYREDGRVTLRNGSGTTFFRCYVYRLEGAVMTVHFQDMRLFHQVTLTRVGDCWQGRGHHLCVADVYSSRYDIAPGRIAITHDVAGPAKDYRLETEYRRAE